MHKISTLGKTPKGLPIFSYEFGKEGPVVLILAGVHGNEPEGNYIALELLQKWIKDFPYKLKLTLVPFFNVEGCLTNERTNSNKIDLNRNLPTKNWTPYYEEEKYYPGKEACSEPENKALVEWINKNPVRFIISLHSYDPMIQVNGDCSPEADIIGKETGYELKDSIGYPTPGCLGDYAALERNIPVITYESERGSSIESALKIHVPAIEKALFETEKREF